MIAEIGKNMLIELKKNLEQINYFILCKDKQMQQLHRLIKGSINQSILRRL